MQKKIIKLSFIFILVVFALLVMQSHVQANKDTQAVENISIITEETDLLPGTIMDAEKLEKRYIYAHSESNLFFLVRNQNLEEMTKLLKENVEITKTNKYYNSLEEIANGKNYLYLGLHISKPEGIAKMELVTESGYDFLSNKDNFDVAEKLEDGSYNLYIEYALKSIDSWLAGAGFNAINEPLTLKYYEKETDATPISQSEVILTPVREKAPEYTQTEPFKSYGLTENNEWVEEKNINFQNYVVGINGENLEELKKGITYDAKTETVIINNIGTNHPADFIQVNTSKLHIIGNNSLAELFCSTDKTTVTMEANAVMEAFITKKAADGVIFELGEEIEETIEYDYTVVDNFISFSQTNILKSTKIKFTDIKTTDWYYKAVKYTYENGMIQGATETEFRPTKNITRGMIVTILWRMEGEEKVTDVTDFPDVTGQYYYDAVRWAAKKGIVSGYQSGKFGPNDAITREQLAAILSNYAKYKGKNTNKTADTSKYADWYKVTGYARPAMQWAVATGVITGKYEGTKVDPQGTATRAEAAGMLYNYCTKIK